MSANLSSGERDFLQNPNSNPTSPLSDIGEAANHDLLGGGGQSRAGRWFWATGFETGQANEVSLIGSGVSVAGTSGVWQGAFALIVSTIATANNFAYMLKNFLAQNSPSGRWGLEAMVACGSRSSSVDMILVNATPTTPNGQFTGALRINIPAAAANLTFQYQNSLGIFTDISGVAAGQIGANFAVDLLVYHNLKIVVDFSTNKYVRAIIDGITYDLSSLSLTASAGGSDVRQKAELVVTTAINGVATAIFDNVVLSADEP